MLVSLSPGKQRRLSLVSSSSSSPSFCPSRFDRLTPVLLDWVFSFCTPCEKISKVENVCRHWRTASLAGCGWSHVKLVFISDGKENHKQWGAMHFISTDIGDVKINGKTNSHGSILLAKLALRLHARTQSLDISKMHLDSVETVALLAPLTASPCLRSIRVHIGHPATAIPLLPLSRLKDSISLILGDEGPEGLNRYLELNVASQQTWINFMSHLQCKHLELRSSNMEHSNFDVPANVFDHLCKAKDCLESLTLAMRGEYSLSFLSQLSVLQVLELDSIVMKEGESLPPMPCLRSLTLRSINLSYKGQHVYPSLRHLSMCQGETLFKRESFSSLQLLLSNHNKQLTHIQLHSFSCHRGCTNCNIRKWSCYSPTNFHGLSHQLACSVSQFP